MAKRERAARRAAGASREHEQEREQVPGQRLLLEFIEKHDIAYRAASKALTVKHPAVWQWAHGMTIVEDHRVRQAIEDWTGGAVPVRSWLRESERKPIVVQPFKPHGIGGR